MAEIRVVNRHREPFDVYIGRGSIWGNPCTLPKEHTDADRDRVIAQYEKHLLQSAELYPRLGELREKTLGCFCAPRRCHGDVLKKHAESVHVSLTGHRPHKLAGYDLSDPFYVRLQARLERIIVNGLEHHPHLTLHSGLALGADTVWSKAILAQREIQPDRITFVAEVPVMSQSSRWPAARDQQFWQHQVDVADRVNIYATTYSPRAMQQRNEGMIAAAQLLLAVHDGSSGGTGNAVDFARKTGVRIFSLPPSSI